VLQNTLQLLEAAPLPIDPGRFAWVLTFPIATPTGSFELVEKGLEEG
jgi:hypothetical protein